MIAAVLKETFPAERRVALIPAILPGLAKLGLEFVVETGAGEAAGFPDAAYAEKGARIAPSRAEALAAGELLPTLRSFARSPFAPEPDLSGLRPGQTLIGFLDPIASPAGVQALAQRGVTALSMELMPRITRAQAMDALSSMATIVGYKAVLLAADRLPKMFPLLMTASGTLAPARVFVIGGGVAGLQAIATAKRLGAVVEAYDIRTAVREQVESLGAKFVELPLETSASQDAGGYAKAMDEEFYRRQRELMLKVVSGSDIVIATAAVPGRKAPVLVTTAMVDAMRPGSVVVDVAAEQGGNCELTRAGETVVRHGVSVLGPLNPASSIPQHASQMYAKNVANFLALLVKDGKLVLDLADEIVRETLVLRSGEIVSPRVLEALGLPAPVTA